MAMMQRRRMMAMAAARRRPTMGRPMVIVGRPTPRRPIIGMPKPRKAPYGRRPY